MRESEKVKIWAEKLMAVENRVGISGLGNLEQHIFGLRREIEGLEADIQEFIEISECANKGRAKSHFRTLMREKRVQVDLTLVREIFHKMSWTWLKGVPKKGKILAEAPLSAERAILEHETLMPRIIRLHHQCSKMPDGEQILDYFEECYLTMGRKQFGNLVYQFVEDIVELEEQEEEQKEKMIMGANNCEVNATLALLEQIKKESYGAGGNLYAEEVSE